MVITKSLILTALIGSLAACSSSPYQSGSVKYPAVVGPENSTSLLVYAVENLYITGKYGLDDAQKYKQNATVYTALETGEYGQVFEWYERTAMGQVKVVHGYPQGSGFCRVVYSQITVKDRSRHFEETACKEAGHDGWRFITR